MQQLRLKPLAKRLSGSRQSCPSWAFSALQWSLIVVAICLPAVILMMRLDSPLTRILSFSNGGPAADPAELVAAMPSTIRQSAAHSIARIPTEAYVEVVVAALMTVAPFDTLAPRHPEAMIEQLPNFHHVTVASKAKPGLEVLRASAAAFGTPLTILGEGDTELGAKGWGDNYGRKILHTINYLKTLPPDAFVVFTDAYDVLVMGSERDARMGFLRAAAQAVLREPTDPSVAGGKSAKQAGSQLPLHGSIEELAKVLSARRLPRIVFSAEALCIDDLREAAFPSASTSGLLFPCLNSGGLAGFAGDLLSFMSSVPWESQAGEDQRAHTIMFGKARVDAALPLAATDTEGELFLSMHEVPDTALVLDPVTHRWRHASLKGAGPTYVHWNGWLKRSSIGVSLLTGEWGLPGTSSRSVVLALALGWVSCVLVLLISSVCRRVRRGAEGDVGGDPVTGKKGAKQQKSSGRRGGAAGHVTPVDGRGSVVGLTGVTVTDLSSAGGDIDSLGGGRREGRFGGIEEGDEIESERLLPRVGAARGAPSTGAMGSSLPRAGGKSSTGSRARDALAAATTLVAAASGPAESAKGSGVLERRHTAGKR